MDVGCEVVDELGTGCCEGEDIGIDCEDGKVLDTD